MAVMVWVFLLDVTSNYADFCTVPKLLTSALPLHSLHFPFWRVCVGGGDTDNATSPPTRICRTMNFARLIYLSLEYHS